MKDTQNIVATAKGAVATFEGAKVAQIQENLSKYQALVAQVSPKDAIDAERIMAIGAQLIATNDQLRKCEVTSIIGALTQAALTGLNPAPQFGEIWFVPFFNRMTNTYQLQMQIGYKGFQKMAYKSGLVESLDAWAVYEGDLFEWELGTTPFIKHKAGENFGDPSKLTHAYAVVRLRGSQIPKFDVINKRQIERLRLKSPMQIERLRLKSPMQKADGLNGAWRSDFDEMAKAKVVKRLLKWLPLEDRWRESMAIDEAVAPEITSFKSDQSGTLTQPLEYIKTEEVSDEAE